MKTYKKIAISLLCVATLCMLPGCEAMLEEPVKSQFAEPNLLSNKSGLISVLVGAYSSNTGSNLTRNIIKRNEMTTDILTQSGGGEEGTATPLINFRWDPSNAMEAIDWMVYWEVIRNCNIVLDNIHNIEDFNSEQERTEIIAETRGLRACAYYSLWEQFGPMPIRTSLEDPLQIPRPTTEEFYEFMEKELTESIADIPDTGDEPAYGRLNKGAVRGLLCIWYLNTLQWQKCADIAQVIISSNKYQLYPDWEAMFAIENKRNSEFMLVKPSLTNSSNNLSLVPTALPWDFYKGLDGGIEGVINEKWSNFASQYRIRDEFYYSFDEKDTRKSRILTKYENTRGVVVDLLVDYTDATRGLKYPPDPDATGDGHGNDVPFIRYAEIILARAEALNELNGPNQESIDLINQIRTRAQVDEVSLGQFATKEAVREQILKERGWEFWYEGRRRRDLIRMDKFIEYAHVRGITHADSKNLWFPIPQSAIDSDSTLKQNDGY